MIRVFLKDICEFEKGSTGLANAIPGKYPLVATGVDRRSCESFQFDTKAVCVPLVSSTGHGHASLKNIHYQEGKFALGSILVALTAKSEDILVIQFLHLYLSELKDKILVPLMSGAANVALSVTKIKNIEIPLPSIARQQEIVVQFKSIVAEEKELTAELARQQTLLKKLRQQILQEAIEGKLTKDWRADNPDLPAPDIWCAYIIECADGTYYKGHSNNLKRRVKEHLSGQGAEWTKIHKATKLVHFEKFETQQEAIQREKFFKSGKGRGWFKKQEEAGLLQAGVEPASELLKRIQEEKEQLIKDKKIKKQKALPPISEEEKPFELPDGWVWCRTNDTCTYIIDCPHSTPRFVNDSNRCIDTTCINMAGDILESKVRRVDIETFNDRNARLIPEAGDIIYSREGVVGQAIIVPQDYPICLGQRVMLFRPHFEISSIFFRYMVTSKFFLEEMFERHRGIGAKHVNMKDLRESFIPLPPIVEQKAIVTKVEKLLTLCDQLESQITSNQSHAEQLMQAVLKEAFSQEDELAEQVTAHA